MGDLSTDNPPHSATFNSGDSNIGDSNIGVGSPVDMTGRPRERLDGPAQIPVTREEIRRIVEEVESLRQLTGRLSNKGQLNKAKRSKWMSRAATAEGENRRLRDELADWERTVRAHEVVNAELAAAMKKLVQAGDQLADCMRSG
jgi:hypothetical protein